jgi:hypothetical protein
MMQYPGSLIFLSFLLGTSLEPIPERVVSQRGLEESEAIASSTLAAWEIPEIPSEALINYPSFNSQRLDQHLRLYARYLEEVGPPDVLIIGSSRALQGLDPITLASALEIQGYSQLKVYNFGINGATAQVVDFLVRHILSAGELPRLIIWADGSRAFNSGRVDRTFAGILESEGYRQVMRGNRPVFPLPEMAETATASRSASPEWCVQVPQPAQEDEQGIHFSPSERNLLPEDEITLSLCQPNEQLDLTFDPSAIPQLLPENWSEFADQHIAPDLELNGFQSVTARFDPRSYYRQFPRVPGAYDSDYSSFRLDGVQMNATIALARFLRDRQIPLIFVNLPLHQDYLDRVRRRYERQFQQHMQQLASQEGFIVRDLTQQWMTESNYFADPSHLNQEGARVVAIAIAADQTIPWQLFQ